MAVDVLTSLNKNGSGLNLRELSTTLATAETASRIEAQNSKVETAQLSISALGQVRSQLNELSAAVTVLPAGSP